MPPNEISKNLGILTAQMTAVQEDVKEIKATTQDADKRGIAFEKEYIEEHAKVTSAVELTCKRIDDHDVKIAEIKTELFLLTEKTRDQLLLLTQSIQPLVAQSKILSRIAIIVGTAIIGLIIAVITGQVQLLFN